MWFDFGGMLDHFSRRWLNHRSRLRRSNGSLFRKEGANVADQRVDLILRGRIHRVEPVRARQVVLFPRFRDNVIDLEWDNDQITIGGQDQLTTYIIR